MDASPETAPLFDALKDARPEGRGGLARSLSCALLSVKLGLADPPAVGRYTVRAALGRGGMGSVFEAYDPLLDRPVALKVLNDAGSDATQELLREGQQLAAVTHPNVLPVHDVGVQQGCAWLATALVEGGSLCAWVAEHPGISTHTLLQRFVEAGRGLAAVHRAGLVHGDFKPDNVLVDGAGIARVSDFGLAVPVGGESPGLQGPPSLNSVNSGRCSSSALGRSSLGWRDSSTSASIGTTSEGGESPGLQGPPSLNSYLTGTARYLAPELLDGAPASVYSDQYAFGVSVGELLGDRRFDAIDDWIARCTAADPEDRWPTMDAVVAELETRLRPPERVVRPDLTELMLLARDAESTDAFVSGVFEWLHRYLGFDSALLGDLSNPTAMPRVDGFDPALLLRFAEAPELYGAPLMALDVASARAQRTVTDVEVLDRTARSGSALHVDLLSTKGTRIMAYARLHAAGRELGSLQISRNVVGARYSDRDRELLDQVIPLISMGLALRETRDD